VDSFSIKTIFDIYKKGNWEVIISSKKNKMMKHLHQITEISQILVRVLSIAKGNVVRKNLRSEVLEVILKNLYR